MTSILIGFGVGRMVLHIVAMAGDHEWGWHWKGIMREVRL